MQESRYHTFILNFERGKPMKKAIIIVIIAAFGLFWAGPAKAALITIAIKATVDYVNSVANYYLEGQISPGDIITGTYTYESTTVDTNPSSGVGDYEHYTKPCGIRLTVGGFVFQTDPDSFMFLLEIINDYTSGGLHDAYGLISYNNLELSNGTPVSSISWWLEDPTANALSSTDLPTTAPVLSDWQSEIGLCLDVGRSGGIVSHVTSAVVIPEPATILLLSMGVLVLRKRQH